MPRRRFICPNAWLFDVSTRSSPMRSSSPMSRGPPPMRSNLPARPPPAAPAVHQQPRQPGMFAQMATTAAGVAVGSAIGHTVGHAMTGGMSGGNDNQVQPINTPYEQTNYQGYNQQNPCQNSIEELLRCTQNESDIGLCSGFSEAVKDCKRLYGNTWTVVSAVVEIGLGMSWAPLGL